ncbi:MAG: hypothetical protein QW189_03995, partial [Thermofilaceae archaeon]
MTSLFRVKHLGFSSGTPLVVIDDGSAAALGVRAHDRLLLRKGGREVTAIVNVALQMPADTILVNEEVARSLNLSEGDVVEIEPAPPPRSSRYIRELIEGAWLNPQEIRTIVEDIVRDRLS